MFCRARANAIDRYFQLINKSAVWIWPSGKLGAPIMLANFSCSKKQIILRKGPFLSLDLSNCLSFKFGRRAHYALKLPSSDLNGLNFRSNCQVAFDTAVNYFNLKHWCLLKLISFCLLWLFWLKISSCLINELAVRGFYECFYDKCRLVRRLRWSIPVFIEVGLSW